MVLFLKGLVMKINMVFLDLVGRWVDLNISSKEGNGGALRLMAVYALTEARWLDFLMSKIKKLS